MPEHRSAPDRKQPRTRRPVFTSADPHSISTDGVWKSDGLYERHEVEFAFYPGFSQTQRRRSVHSFHEQYRAKHPDHRVLEVSTASSDDVGRAASAFNLLIRRGSFAGRPVESVYQSCKVFRQSFTGELSQISSLASEVPQVAKRKNRDNNASLVEWTFRDESIGLDDTWAKDCRVNFYDWLYIFALRDHPDLVERLSRYDAFTDISFNPIKSYNTQARACAIAVTLFRKGGLELIERFLVEARPRQAHANAPAVPAALPLQQSQRPSSADAAPPADSLAEPGKPDTPPTETILDRARQFLEGHPGETWATKEDLRLSLRNGTGMTAAEAEDALDALLQRGELSRARLGRKMPLRYSPKLSSA